MPRNGAGTYTLPSGNPVVTGTVISSTVQNNTMTDIATALTQSIASNGQTPITANIPMAGYKLTGLAAATIDGDAIRYQQVFPSLSTSTIVVGSGGLVFPATPSLSSDPNTLDDYEEGTWTLSVGGSATYTGRSGTYQKIGNSVYVCGDMTINSIGTGNVNTISGLPFTTTAVDQGGSVGYFTSLTSNVVFYSCFAPASGTTVNFVSCTSAAATSSVGGLFGNSTHVCFSLTYRTAS